MRDRSPVLLFATEFIPRTYLISPEGTICAACIGYVEEEFEQLKQELEKQLALEKKPAG